MSPAHRLLPFLSALLLLLTLYALPHSASAAEKPVIAITEVTVADDLSKPARRHLQLEKLQAELESSVAALRKFRVVTRSQDALQQVRREELFSTTEAAAGDAAQPGHLKNADFLLLPKVTRFAFYSTSKKVPNLQNKYFRTDHGTLELSCQVIDSSSGEIKATMNVKKGFSTRERMVNGRHSVPSDSRFTSLAKGVATRVADQLVETVFPMKIITIKGEKLYLNRGSDGGLHHGDVLNVYSPGEQLIDPDTGENLGTTEEYVGKLKVDRVNPKFTTAVLLPDKSRGEIEVGCIVRKP